MTKSVIFTLSEMHGIQARPGTKVECPFCHHKTFSIKQDDTLGKCFHPNCGRYITCSGYSDSESFGLGKILEDIFQDFHSELLKLKNKGHYKTAYHYLTEERKIHPKVIEDSMLGAVPSGYDLKSKFVPLIQSIESKIELKSKEQKGRGRPRNEKGFTLEQKLELIKEAKEKLENCIRNHAGYLVFFYTNAYHLIVSARFRKPYSKDIVYFKPHKNTAGVFGHGLFSPYTGNDENKKAVNDLLIVTEGEFNQLQLQSLAARVAEGEGKPPESGYVNACAVGGVMNADIETICKISKNPIICYDND